MAKVVVAMSGGVDSSTTAAILKQEGCQVIGVTIRVWPPDEVYHPEAIDSARETAQRLGIPHQVMDLRGIFQQKIINDFCHQYRRGKTPNPCIRCNRYIKFGVLLDSAQEMGAEFIATGHYARIQRNHEDGRYLLKSGLDRSKDQSYTLYSLTQDQLKHTLLPLGELTKERVRELARELGLSVADRPESQDVCFIPDGNYATFLRGHLPTVEPGAILDRQGRVIGQHQGIPFYTIGQHKGLGIPSSEPLYVTAINQERNTITVGTKSATYGDEFTVAEVNWIALTGLTHPIRVEVKIRYRHKEVGALIIPREGNRVCVKLDEPQMAITPGQAAVFYDGDVVVGGGIIDQVETR